MTAFFLMLNVCIVSVGKVNEISIDILIKNLPVYFHVNATKLAQIDIPKVSFNQRRGQFNSSIILEYITELKRGDCDFILGITDVDLYTDALNFVFGEANPRYGVCIISTFRLRPEFYGRNFDLKIFTKRILTEAVHELGHLLNLKHCTNPKCVMFFSNSIIDTDRKSFLFCEKCNEKAKIQK